MFKRVDVEEAEETLEGFCYTNLEGDDESVIFTDNTYPLGRTVSIDSSCEQVEVYLEDIPKLIKALQATYDYVKGAK